MQCNAMQCNVYIYTYVYIYISVCMYLNVYPQYIRSPTYPHRWCSVSTPPETACLLSSETAAVYGGGRRDEVDTGERDGHTPLAGWFLWWKIPILNDLKCENDPGVNVYINVETMAQRNRWFSHRKWWFSTSMLVYPRVTKNDVWIWKMMPALFRGFGFQP